MENKPQSSLTYPVDHWKQVFLENPNVEPSSANLHCNSDNQKQ